MATIKCKKKYFWNDKKKIKWQFLFFFESTKKNIWQKLNETIPFFQCQFFFPNDKKKSFQMTKISF